MVEPSKGSSINSKTGLTYNYCYFLTKSLVEFNDLESMFYVKLSSTTHKIKVIPKNIFDLLTPIGLAFWLMDDGNKTGRGIHLNTNAFKKKRFEIIIRSFKS
jgi:LAGLIDADG DNA endonuclease family